MEPIDDYNPYLHREIRSRTTNLETLIHLVKSILGTGVLALPEAFLCTGFLVGTTFLLIITVLITYCFHILFRGMYVICNMKKIPQINYPQAIKAALTIGPECLRHYANLAPYIVNFFIVVYQIGMACIFNLFVVTNIKQIVDHNTDDVNHFSVKIYMVFLIIPLLAVTYIRNLKVLVPFSNIGNWITLTALIIVYYYIFRDIGPISDRNLFKNFKDFPLFMGKVMFAVSSFGVILSLESKMETPQNWSGSFGVLNQGILIITILNLITGFGGYWRYGDKVESSITLNLPIDEPLTWAVRILFAVAIYISYALHLYPATEILWEQYIQEHMLTSQFQTFWEYVVRTILVLLTFLLSVAVPRLGLFISLFGTFCLSMLGLVFPPILEICLLWPNYFRHSKWIFIKDYSLIIVGILVFITGTYTSVYEIIKWITR